MKVLCVGSSNLEITCPIDGNIGDESIIKVTEKFECGGGNAGNVAYLLGKWGVETYIASMVGSDDAAAKIKKEYETIGVKTDYIETTYDRGTSERIVLVNKETKGKTIIDLPNNVFLKKYAFNVEPDVIITDGSDYNASIAAFDKNSKAMTFLTVTDTSNDALELGKYVNYIILNKKAAEKITNSVVDYNNSGTLVNIYNLIKQRYNKAEIVITLGERGSVYSINGQVKIMPPVKVEVVDTNGAGSIFVGAFAYAMGRNFGLEKAIAYATIAASLSTAKMTGRMSIPALGEVSNYYDSKFGAQNNPNNTNSDNNTDTGASVSATPNTTGSVASSPVQQNVSDNPNSANMEVNDVNEQNS